MVPELALPGDITDSDIEAARLAFMEHGTGRASETMLAIITAYRMAARKRYVEDFNKGVDELRRYVEVERAKAQENPACE